VKDLEMGRVSWIIPQREHEGPEKREAEGDLTADENIGDVVVGTETTVMGF